MFYIILAVILGLLIIGALGVAIIGPSEGTDSRGRPVPGVKGPALATAAGLGAVLLVLTLLFSATTVSARAVGIQTSFGKYVTTLDNGFHLTAPWASVEEFSTMNQPLHIKEQEVSFAGTTVVDPVTKQETVSGSGGSGNFSGTLMWAIDPTGKGAEKLWEKYRSYDNVRDNLVDKAFREAGRVVIGAYNPVEAKDGANLRAINEAVLADLKGNLASRGIVVDSVTITDVTLGESAQNSLNRIVEANAATERAKAEKERASIDAETAKIRRDSGNLSPEALTRQCLDVTNAWDVNKNGPLPAGWTCTPSGAPFVVTK